MLREMLLTRYRWSLGRGKDGVRLGVGTKRKKRFNPPHSGLDLRDLVRAVLPRVVLAQGLELLVDPRHTDVESSRDDHDSGKGGLQQGEEDVEKAPVLGAGAPVSHDGEHEDQNAEGEGPLDGHPRQRNLSDMRVLCSVRVGRNAHEHHGHNLQAASEQVRRRKVRTTVLRWSPREKHMMILLVVGVEGVRGRGGGTKHGVPRGGCTRFHPPRYGVWRRM